jgi:uncharacterized protein (TIGR00299 family) protein
VNVAGLLYLEPVGGIAGDMFLGAALAVGVDRGALESALATLGVPFHLDVRPAEAQGIAGLHVEVVPEGPQPHHRRLPDIRALIGASGLPPRARDAALALFERIGAAEAAVHGIPLEDVHFHEVGAIDSIADLCGAAVVMDLLGWPRAVSLPPELGQGMARTAHGPLPVPAPATLEILRGSPVRAGGPPGEAVTPTGAAILATLCEIGEPPLFTPRRTGYGVGTVRWPDRANVLRMTLAEASDPLTARRGVVQIEANLDDCPGQLVARAIEAALEAGALDAWAIPCTMKKGRPGIVLAALAGEDLREAVVRALLAETTTLGVRIRPVERVELERALVGVETEYGVVRVKVGRLAGDVLGAHPEYEDCVARARERGVAVKEVMAAAAAAWRGGPGRTRAR